MILYKNIFYFTILFLPTAFSHNKELRIIKSGSAPASICKIGLEFNAELNNTSDEDFHVELIPDDCCLRSDDGEDCDSLQIIGECSEVIPKETTKTLTLVAPLIDPFERTGYCIIHVDSRPIDRRRNIMRDTLNIHFDTRIKEKLNPEEDIKHCKHIDEDPLNDCKPVNCETYYNGKRSYFDKHSKRCLEVPRCIDLKRNKFKQVYDPNNNKCVDEESIDKQDIDFIKSLSAKERHPKDILIIKSMNKPLGMNYTNTIDSFKELNVINDTKVKAATLKTKILCHTLVQYFLTNRYTLLVLALVVTVQCCLIITMVYCLTNSSACCNKKKVVRKFFNYRQDASVTTPLIGTSNMDTETTEFDYISESSNIDKKIKCYKACQKEQQAKISMSDDILLKCLNRRDWNSQPRSKEITEIKRSNKEPEDIKIVDNIDINKDKDEEISTKTEPSSKNIQSEKDSAISEKEIKCHNYNLTQSKVEFKALDNNITLKENSVTTDKGAQACFSNDSIDDFLSERGMIFLGEGASKYSFTSTSSPDKSSVTELTSKTSKNNIIKNVMSLLSKSKMGTSSDPGVKKKNKNLELLHISHASVYSSSSELKNVKGIKLVKESRSTF